MTTCGKNAGATSRASRPSCAVRTSCPERRRISASASAASSLSSTTRIRQGGRSGTGGSSASAASSDRRELACSSLRGRQRQRDGQRRAWPVSFARRGDGAAVHLDEPANQGETDAQPTRGPIERAVGLREQLEDHAAASPARMPTPESVIRIVTCGAFLRATVKIDPPSGIGELGRVVQDVAEHLRQPGRVAVHRRGRRPADARAADAGVRRCAGRLDSTACVTTLPRDRHAPQADESARDPRDVHEIVDQPHEVLHLPLDHGDRVRALCERQIGQPDQLGGEPDRRQGIAQLVRERGEELVLPPAGFLQLRGALGDPQLEIAVQPFELRASCGAAPRRR